jgi:hypothetical protein
MEGKSPAPPEAGTSKFADMRGRLGGGMGAIAELVNAGRTADKPPPRSKRGGSAEGAKRVTPPPGPVPLAKKVKDALQYLQEAEGEPRSWQEMAAAPQLQRCLAL